MGDPIIDDTDHRARRALAWTAGFLVLCAVVGVLVAVVYGRLSDDDDGRTETVAVTEAPRLPGSGDGGDGADAEEGEPADTTASTTTAPVSLDLLRTDATPAVDAFRDRFGGPFQAVELVLYRDYAILQAQDPAAPTHLDRYLFRAGEVGEPDPVRLSGGDDFGPDLFSLDEVRFDLLPAMATQALDAYELEREEVSHIIIGRFLPFDERVSVRVYVSDPERGGGGYARFTATGELVDVIR
ncbi:hypothetical protein BH20ACT2_BH20ACT2_05090 [soil metagenome]